MSQVLLQDQTCVTPNSQQSPLLLQDLIIEILSRLPVKTLMRFRAVCKTWKKVISSSNFKRHHFGHEGNRTDLLVYWKGIAYIPDLRDPEYDDSLYLNSFSLFPYERLESPVELGKEFFKEEMIDEVGVWGVCGPCHGILCVCFDDMIALWNPATRNLWPIPESPLNADNSLSQLSFWIDPLTNEFKVFGILSDISHEERVKPIFVVYTSCNNSWKELEAPFYPGDFAWNSQCFRYSVSNGMYYFHINRETGRILFAYDIFKDMFQEIQMPKIGVSCDGPVLDLFNDSLALFAVENVDDVAVVRTEIWVMKEKGCWSKVFNGDIPMDKPGLYQALGFWSQKEIFIYCFSYDLPHICELMIYDLVSGEAQKILVEPRDQYPRGVGGSAGFFPLSYKESLISIDINGS